MAFQIKIANREINPRVVNFFTFENNVNTLEFELDSYIYDEVDLRNYKAYAVTSINGKVDLTELEMSYDQAGDKLHLTWNVGEYTLTETGGIVYQITFKENADDGEGSAVWYSYKAVMINRGTVDADYKIVAEFPTIMSQWLDKINKLSGQIISDLADTQAQLEVYIKEATKEAAKEVESTVVYIPFGETVAVEDRLEGKIYYQFLDEGHTQGQFEDHLGNVLTSAGSGASLPLFAHFFTDYILNDASYLRADTFSWQSGDIYPSAYEHLAADYESANKLMKGSVTETYYETSNEGGAVTEGNNFYASYFCTKDAEIKVGSVLYCFYDGANGRYVFTNEEDTVVVTAIDTSAGTLTYEGGGSSTTTPWSGLNGKSFEYAREIDVPLTETIGSTTIEYAVAKDGHKIVLAGQEEAVADIYAETGVAWYYILDTENKRFKLPRTKHAFTGMRTGVGNFVEAGLPNITGSFAIRGGFVKSATGAIYQTASNNSEDNTGNGNWGPDGAFDASRSSEVYGNSETVQPPATEQYLYFYVGNYVRLTAEVDTGALTELVNDFDITVISKQVEEVKQAAIVEVQTVSAAEISKVEATGLDGLQAQIDSLKAELQTMLGRLDFANAETISIKSSGTYTCPSDGYVQFTGVGQASNQFVTINGVDFCTYTAISNGTINLVPVSKGDVIGASSLSAVVSITFIPQKGV